MLSRLSNRLAGICVRNIPEAFPIAILLTILVFMLATTQSQVSVVVDAWGKGFFGWLAFTVQMMLMMCMGYAIAEVPIVKDNLVKLFHKLKTSTQVVWAIAFISMTVSYFNWCLALVLSIFLVKIATEILPKVRKAVFIAAGYTCMLVLHSGVSATIPLIVASKDHTLEDKIGLIPISETVFQTQNLIILAVLYILVPFMCTWFLTKEEKEQTPSQTSYYLGQALKEDIKVRLHNKYISHKIDNSKLLAYTAVILPLYYIVYTFCHNQSGVKFMSNMPHRTCSL